MHRRSQSESNLAFDPEIEATARRLNADRRRREREQPTDMGDRPLGEQGVPKPAHATLSCIVPPAIAPNDFELKTNLIQYIERNQFGGAATESPNDHLSDFTDKCNTIKMNGIPPDAIKLLLFPFSLRDKAKVWLKSEPPNKYATWNDLATGFLTKFFPPRKTSEIRTKLQTFKQLPFESYHEAWKRFKDLQRQPIMKYHIGF